MDDKKVGLPPLDWLRVFEAAGRLGGFSAAAREFGISQAAVSQRMGNLEAWLGRSLFVREARGVSLTTDGESYLPLVQDSLTALERNTEDLFGTAPKELRLAALSSHIDTLILPRVGAFWSQYPNVRLVTDSVAKRSEFDEERTWLQLRYGRGAWAGRKARLIEQEVLVPMLAPDAQGQDLPRIEVRGERPGWQDWSRETGGTVPGGASLSVDSMVHGLRAAREGLGVVLGSLPLAQPDLTTGNLVQTSDQKLKTRDGYWLTWPEDRLYSKSLRRLVFALLDDLIAGTLNQTPYFRGN
ncbi:LysR family transcriptional regulator [Falsiruegeria mediterranea]|uniref:Glycine cleavage system transcriptional activator n=1 Tax=Falsiruegeria mediterranea M17 TaxID=1200281 RepID=A0A2R8C2Q3_9RHOB|nr:LysR family transcriptional regulator [Falsiruegeria mediterranea]SPJ26613.1 Glycine cleavage system transcriptional activator [Falsiruegeria mediterranea M17]